MPSNFFISLPYDEFCSLIEASRLVPVVLEQNKRIQDQNEALRCMFLECLEKIHEFGKNVSD